MEAWNYYWNNIEDWSDNSGTNIELYDTVPNHEEMHKECIRYDNWIHAKTDPSVVSQDVINILRNNFEDAPSMKWDGGKFVPDTIWKRWFAVPNAEHFPSIHKFLEDNKHQYHLSVISKPPNSLSPTCSCIIELPFLISLSEKYNSGEQLSYSLSSNCQNFKICLTIGISFL